MKEHACKFGPEFNLVGILTEPVGNDARGGQPVLLVLNAGLLHRVGPNRMSVELARRLAECGICTLRFDMGGYGDSEVSADAQFGETRSFSEIKSAMDYLGREHDVHRFVLLGLCSGADNSHAAALRDPRVAGTIQLDGYGYRTPQSCINFYLPRIFRPQAWVRLARRRFSASSEKLGGRAPLRQQLRRPFGPRRQLKREVQLLVDRGVQMLYFYTGEAASYFNYAGQFFDMFRGLDPRGMIEVECFPNADHTYTFAEDRERMYERLIEWYRSRTWNTN
jgi:pimeloyl-ACP methyl ester carboxylesterase